jgi:hypothetical protein
MNLPEKFDKYTEKAHSVHTLCLHEGYHLWNFHNGTSPNRRVVTKIQKRTHFTGGGSYFFEK